MNYDATKLREYPLIYIFVAGKKFYTLFSTRSILHQINPQKLRCGSPSIKSFLQTIKRKEF